MVFDSLAFTWTVGQWIADGAVVPIVVLWCGLVLAKRGLTTLLSVVISPEFLVGRPRSLRVGLRYVGVGVLVDWLTTLVPGLASEDAPLATHVTDDGYGLLPQLIGLGGGLAVVEELLFRGFPLALAIGLGLTPWHATLLVMAGTALWALLRGTGNGIAIVLTTGWLLAALWLAGHWPLAVLLAALYGGLTGSAATLLNVFAQSTEEWLAAADDTHADDTHADDEPATPS